MAKARRKKARKKKKRARPRRPRRAARRSIRRRRPRTRRRPKSHRSKRRRSTRRHRARRRRLTTRTAARRGRSVRGWWKLPKEKLLDLRLCDLNLRIEGSPIRVCVRQLYRELRLRDFVFRPSVWLSNEWFTPDGVSGVAVPFYLAHPRLRALEREFMLEVEGGTQEWCLKLLRHETGHALLNAYQLHRRRDWQEQFGRSSDKYPETYLPKPYSKRFVIHLENWYAQAHPHEDWAETFAVWLKPRSDWRTRYADWPALKKLEYVERLMQEVCGRRPLRRNRRPVEPVHRITQTLRNYYTDKQARYRIDKPEFLDRDLRRLFSDAEEYRGNEKASRYLRRMRGSLIETVGRWTSEYNYRTGEVLTEMTARCDELDLHLMHDEHVTKDEVIACLTALIMNKLHSGGFHIRL
jgi:hypothetical protein